MIQNNSSMLLGLSSTSLGADMHSGPIRIREANGFAIQLNWTGATGPAIVSSNVKNFISITRAGN